MSAPEPVGLVAAHTGVGTAAYLVERGRGALHYGQCNGVTRDDVTAVRLTVGIEGGGRTDRAFGRFAVLTGRDATYAGIGEPGRLRRIGVTSPVPAWIRWRHGDDPAAPSTRIHMGLVGR